MRRPIAPAQWLVAIDQDLGNAGRLCHLQFRAGSHTGSGPGTAADGGLPLQYPHPWRGPAQSRIRASLGRFDLVLPDGMPVVWALNCGGAVPERSRIRPVFHATCVATTPRPWRHFFFGDSEECLVELRRVLLQLQPDIEIVGMLSPPFRPFTQADEASFAEAINRADPDFVWVALPGVRMEQWIIDNQARYRSGVFLAVGDAFTLLSGRRSFAPRWMQRMGLTWVYRLSKEPLRLGPRYVRYQRAVRFLFPAGCLGSVAARRRTSLEP